MLFIERRGGVGSRSYRDSIAWQHAIDLTDQIYACTKGWPSNEALGPTSQVRRAAVSLAANIAEGQGRNGSREFIHHLGIVHGSLCELETLIVIARRQSYATEEHEAAILVASGRLASLIHGLIKSLRST